MLGKTGFCDANLLLEEGGAVLERIVSCIERFGVMQECMDHAFEHLEAIGDRILIADGCERARVIAQWVILCCCGACFCAESKACSVDPNGSDRAVL